MKVLALDTSTEVAGTALLVDGQVRFDYRFLHRMDLSQRLLPAVRWLLQDAGITLAEIDALAVGLGPGSFTGVRIGVTTIKTLAQVTGKPVVGIGTLAAIAAAFAPCVGALVCPCIDARKHEVYTALYRIRPEEPEEVTPPDALSALALAEQLSGLGETVLFCGTGAARYRETLEGALGDRFRYPPDHDFPDPVVLARLGLRRMERGERDDPLALRPVYVRPSEAERVLIACS